jgi:ribose transport system substrate-binding protein
VKGKSFVAIAAAGLLAALSGCGAASGTATDSPAASSAADQPKVIGVMTLVESNEAVSRILAGVKRRAAEEGIEIKVIDANFDVQKQVSAVQSFVNQKVDGIINISGDNGVMAGGFLAAKKAHIPVVSILGGDAVPGVIVNRPLPEADLGAAAAKLFFKRVEAMGVSNPTVIEQVLPDATPCRLREQGFDRVAPNYPDVKVIKYPIDATNAAAAAFTYSEQNLASNSDIVGVLSCWDVPALSAVKAAEKRGKTADSFIVVGYNAESPAVEELRKPSTTFIATVGFALAAPGHDAVDDIIALAKGEQRPAAVPVIGEPFTKDNLPPAGATELAEWLPKGWPANYWDN